jgi:hypothetical protein
LSGCSLIANYSCRPTDPVGSATKQGQILPEPEVFIGLAQPLPIDSLQDRERAMTTRA